MHPLSYSVHPPPTVGSPHSPATFHARKCERIRLAKACCSTEASRDRIEHERYSDEIAPLREAGLRRWRGMVQEALRKDLLMRLWIRIVNPSVT